MFFHPGDCETPHTFGSVLSQGKKRSAECKKEGIFTNNLMTILKIASQHLP